MLSVKETWSGRWASLKAPWRARREFTVDGAANETAALAAVDDADPADKIPQADDEHPQNPNLQCEGPQIKACKGPTFWVITAEYSIDPDTQPANPLNKLPTFTFTPAAANEPVDFDLDSRPILNTAGDPRGGCSRDVTYWELVIDKNVAVYDANWAKTYMHAVNAAPVTFMGITFDIEHLKCERIYPYETMTAKAKYVPCRFQFAGFLDDTFGKYPWQHRILDAGDYGNYTSESKKRRGPFNNGTGVQISNVRLDGSGKPLLRDFPDVKVGDQAAFDPVSPTNAVLYYQREFYSDAGTLTPLANNSTVATFLYFKKARVVDFSPLTALL